MRSTDAAGLVPAAFHATRYADWTHGAFCRLPRAASMARLSGVERSRVVARASARRAYAALYTVPDCYQAGAAVYAAPVASAAPAYDAWQADMLDAIRRVRRWRYYSTDALPPALPAQALDGCRCRVCLLR